MQDEDATQSEVPVISLLNEAAAQAGRYKEENENKTEGRQ